MRIDLIGCRHPLSITDFKPAKNENTSSSSQSTSSTTTNQDVAAQSGAVAVGAGASYVNEFSPDVASSLDRTISNVFEFGRNTVAALSNNTSLALQTVSAEAEHANTLAVNAINGANSLSTGAVNAAQAIANQATNNAQLGQSSIFTNPAVLIAGVVAIGLIVFFTTKRR